MSRRYELSEAFGVRSVQGASLILPPGMATVRPSRHGFSVGLGNHEPIEIAALELDRLLSCGIAIPR